MATVISSDGSFTPPVISDPTLVLRASYGDGHDVQVDWEWAYQVGDSQVRAELHQAPGDTGYRDPAAEQAVLDSLRLGGLPGDPALVPSSRLGGLDTMRFTTELLPLLTGQPGVAVEVTGEPADYREAGRFAAHRRVHRRDSGRQRLVRPRGHDHGRGPRGPVHRRVHRAQPRRVAPAAPRRRLLQPGQARTAAARQPDRGGPGPAGSRRRPAADQPVPGRAVGRAGRARRGRPPGPGVAAAGAGTARGQRGRRDLRVRPRAAAGHPAGPAASLPAGRVRLAGVPVAAPPRRHPRRRHGARQDARGAGADLPRPAGGPGQRAVPRRRADQRRAELGGRVRPVHSRPEGGDDHRHAGPQRRRPGRGHRGRRRRGHLVHAAAPGLRRPPGGANGPA